MDEGDGGELTKRRGVGEDGRGQKGANGFWMEHAMCGKDLVVYGLWHATQCACDAVWLFVKEMPAFVYNMFINENGLNILHTNNEAYEPVPRSILNEIGIMSTCKTPLWALGASRASI